MSGYSPILDLGDAPLTPREKVARIVDPAAFLFTTDELMKGDTSQYDALRKADAVLTALASGSGDQIPGPDDVTAPSQMGFLSALGEAAWEQPPHTGSGDHVNHSGDATDIVDHAELARLVDEMVGLIAPSQGERLLEYERHQFDVASRIQTLSSTLLAENAALRAELGQMTANHDIWTDIATERLDRATEAERKLAEAVAKILDMKTRLARWEPKPFCEPPVSSSTFLSSKEAERG